MVRRLIVALTVVAIMVADGRGCPVGRCPDPWADGFLRALGTSVVRVRVGVLVLLVVAVVLQPLARESLVRGLGRLGVGSLCWPRVLVWRAVLGAHSSDPEYAREGQGLRGPGLSMLSWP